MTDFLSEIEAEHHQNLLERGNLDGSTRRKAGHLWHGASNYVFQGYFARVLRTTCLSCGCSHDALMGVFSREVNSRGDKKELALDTRKVTFNAPIPREYLPISAPSCLDCLP